MIKGLAIIVENNGNLRERILESREKDRAGYKAEQPSKSSELHEASRVQCDRVLLPDMVLTQELPLRQDLCGLYCAHEVKYVSGVALEVVIPGVVEWEDLFTQGEFGAIDHFHLLALVELIKTGKFTRKG